MITENLGLTIPIFPPSPDALGRHIVQSPSDADEIRRLIEWTEANVQLFDKEISRICEVLSRFRLKREEMIGHRDKHRSF
jgi:hypothetical protein